MISIEHTKNRAEKTRDAQVNLAAAPGWVWSKKTVIQWNTDITLLEQCTADESAKRVQWRNAAESWQSDINQIQAITRLVASIGRVQFQDDPVKVILFDRIRTDGEGRNDIYEQGVVARDVWQEVDMEWELSEVFTLSFLSSLLTAALARKGTHGTKETTWRRAEAALTVKARALHKANVAWYTEATRRFAEDTEEGATIRTTIPTSSRPERLVRQAIISNVTVSGGDIQFSCSAPNATRYTILHQPPGATAFVVLVADTAEESVTLHGQPAGQHKFKVIGRNSRGEGPESAVTEVTVAAQAAA